MAVLNLGARGGAKKEDGEGVDRSVGSLEARRCGKGQALSVSAAPEGLGRRGPNRDTYLPSEREELVSSSPPVSATGPSLHHSGTYCKQG